MKKEGEVGMEALQTSGLTCLEQPGPVAGPGARTVDTQSADLLSIVFPLVATSI